MTSSEPARPGAWSSVARSWWAWAVAAVVVVAVALALQAGRSGSQPLQGQAAGSTTGSPAPTTGSPTGSGSASPAPTAGATGAAPSATASGESAPTTPPAPGARPTQPPVALDAPAAPVANLEVTLAPIEAVTGVANIPGEVGGPSLRITVRVDNRTGAAVDLTSAVVNLYYGAQGTPALTLLEPGHRDFPGQVAAGESAEVVRVFLVPPDQRGQVTVEFDLSSGTPVVLFAGPVSV